jgi:hypothetical protein
MTASTRTRINSKNPRAPNTPATVVALVERLIAKLFNGVRAPSFDGRRDEIHLLSGRDLLFSGVHKRGIRTPTTSPPSQRKRH